MMAMQTRWTSVIAGLGFVMLAASASQVSATTRYSAAAFPGFAGGAADNNSPTPVLVTGFIPLTGFGGSVSGTAASSQGHLGASLTLFESPGVGVNAQLRTDVVFTPTAGSTLTTIPVALNLNAQGGSTHNGYSYHVEWNLSGQIGAVFTFAMDTAIEGDTVEGDVSSHTESNIALTKGFETRGGGADTLAGTLTTASVMVPVNQPVTVGLSLTVGGFGSGGATGAFLHSFDFPLTNVFTLPDGFTVNDPDVFLVNNDFRSPTATTPLPAGLPLFATGLGGLGLLGWRRKRRIQAAA